jgi:nucleoside-diphosphate kinase
MKIKFLRKLKYLVNIKYYLIKDIFMADILKGFNELIEDLKKGPKSLNDLTNSLDKVYLQPKQVHDIAKTIDKLLKKPNRTLTIIKPDAVKEALIGEVITRLEKEGIKPVGMKMIKINRIQANLFYGHLKKKIPKKVFNSIVDYMTSNRVVLIVWQGEHVLKKVRILCGPTDPKKAKKSQIRSLSDESMVKQFNEGKAVKNIIHSSETYKDARKEIGFFFLPWEIIKV